MYIIYTLYNILYIIYIYIYIYILYIIYTIYIKIYKMYIYVYVYIAKLRRYTFSSDIPPSAPSVASLTIIFIYYIWIKKLRGHLLHNPWFLI